MTYPIIFMDECGYTGSDLLNKEQPIFTLATLNCTDKQAEGFLKSFFKGIGLKELKHSFLSRYEKQQMMVIDFIRYLAKNKRLIKVTIVHKQYAVVAKMVDIIVEELAHEDGIDFYRRGANIAYTNLIYSTIPCFAGEAFFNKMLLNFQELMRTRTEQSYDKFFSLFFNRDFPKELAEILSPFQAFHLRIGKEILSFPKVIFEVTLGCAVVLITQWRDCLKKDMILVHDVSADMAKNKEMWDSFVDPKLSPSTVGYDRRKITFPVGVKETIFEDSINSAGLQLVDIIAGAFTRWGRYLISRKKLGGLYEKNLDKILPGGFVDTSIWPTKAIIPADLGTNGEDSGNIIDYTARIIRKRK